MELLLLTADPEPSSVLPALGALSHQLHPAIPELAALFDSAPHDVVILDARAELVTTRALCRLIANTGVAQPVAAVFTEAGLVAVSTDWGLDEILLPGSSPAEIDARLRLLPPFHRGPETAAAVRRTRPLVHDPAAVLAQLSTTLDLAWRETAAGMPTNPDLRTATGATRSC